MSAERCSGRFRLLLECAHLGEYGENKLKIVEHILPSRDVIVCPIGDTQYGNPACSVKYVNRYLNWTKELAFRVGAQRRFIGTGDYLDLMSPSNRARYRASGLYSSTLRTLRDLAVEPTVRQTYELLGPHLTGETVALCQGHHWMHFDEEGLKDESGQEHFHSDKWLAAMVGAPFVQGAVLVKFVFPSGRIYRILATHGQGNGASLSYGINKLDKQSSSWEAIDAFAMGHSHKAGIVASTRIREEDGKLVSRQVPLITCGGFMKAYLVDEVNYPEEQQLSSLALSATALRLTEVDESNEGLLIQPMLLL